MNSWTRSRSSARSAWDGGSKAFGCFEEEFRCWRIDIGVVDLTSSLEVIVGRLAADRKILQLVVAISQELLLLGVREKWRFQKSHCRSTLKLTVIVAVVGFRSRGPGKSGAVASRPLRLCQVRNLSTATI